MIAVDNGILLRLCIQSLLKRVLQSQNQMWNMQSLGVSDMKALLKLNCSIIFGKRAREKLYTHFEDVKIALLQTEI
jgi:hypothetical protein